MNTYVFFLSGRDYKKEIREQQIVHQWASCRNRTCCANLPVIAVHTYKQH